MVKSTMTGTVTSSGRGGTAAAMAQNEQTAEEHSTLEQQPPGRLGHPAWCVVGTVQPPSTLKHSEDADVNLFRQSAVRWRVSARYDCAVPLMQRYARTHNRELIVALYSVAPSAE